MKILVLPDIHGRDFWREPCEDIEQYDKVIFLGDYLDPYDFEKISVGEAIDNFKDILLFAKDNPKVVMLLGNHDMPYLSDTYYGFNTYHCRHSHQYHKEIHTLFKENEDLFRVGYAVDDVLFTHAGCTPAWLGMVFGEKYKQEGDDVVDLDELCNDLNALLKSLDGLLNLYKVSYHRGGTDTVGSCMWAHYVEVFESYEGSKSKYSRDWAFYKVKQVFGHTIQAYGNYDENYNIVYSYGGPIEEGNLKMIDTAHAYELDTKEFTIKQL